MWTEQADHGVDGIETGVTEAGHVQDVLLGEMEGMLVLKGHLNVFEFSVTFVFYEFLRTQMPALINLLPGWIFNVSA